MKALTTADKAHVTERQKAWARLALLTVVGLVCPPLAAARSGFVWGIYLVLAVLYSLWAVRISRAASRDRQLGYLLCATDALVLVPILVWSIGAPMRVVLVFLWVVGAATTWRSAVAARQPSPRKTESRHSATSRRRSPGGDRSRSIRQDAPLERAIRARLRDLQVERTRFAIVLLRVAGHDVLVNDRGKEATRELLREVGRRGLCLLGPDAQLFLLPGGRMAFVFATDSTPERVRYSGQRADARIDPYDVESLAMALAREACDQALDRHSLECVVGWASAPADGTTADDLMYAAESGALSSAAFRRVGGPRLTVPEPERKRAIAG
jgi:hypothetical protein